MAITLILKTAEDIHIFHLGNYVVKKISFNLLQTRICLLHIMVFNISIPFFFEFYDMFLLNYSLLTICQFEQNM